jgi:hypothetical protein
MCLLGEDMRKAYGHRRTVSNDFACPGTPVPAGERAKRQLRGFGT